MIDRPGVYHLSAEEYLSDPAPAPSLSSGLAHLLLSQSPRHARWASPRLNAAYVPEEAEHLDLGRAAHQFILEGTTNFVIIPAKDWRTTAAKDAREAARSAGKVPLLERQWTALETMVREALLPQFAELDPPPFTGGKAESTIIWEEQGVWLRIRPDYLYAWGADDLKTTQGIAHPAVWTRRLFDAGYDLQCALYVRGIKAVLGFEPEFRFIVCEIEPPHGVGVIALDPEALAFATTKVERAIALWRQCLTTDTWPAYPTRICYAEAPAYEQARWLERTYYEEVAQ